MAFLRSYLGLGLSIAIAACSSSSNGGNDGSGGGDGASSPCGSDADLCAAQAKTCGALAVVDKCGAARTAQCGDCAAPLSCGGGGQANVCGASCDQGCPASFACNPSGVCAGGSARGLGLDVKTATLAGKVTLNGGPLGAGAHCANDPTDAKLRVSFADPTSGASFSADVPCSAADGAFSLSMEPGTYRVTAYSVYSDASSVPGGTFVLDPALAVTTTNAPAALDLKTTALTGKVTLDGGPLGDGAHCTNNPTDAKLRVDLVEVTSGAAFSADVPCGLADGSFATQVAPGTYAVSAYSVYSDASNVPPGTFALAPSFTVGSGPAAFDVKTTSITGKLTLDGGPLGTGAHCTNNPTDGKMRVTFVDRVEGGGSFSADVACGATDDSFSLRLAPGTYRVAAYGVYSDASNVPAGTFVVAPSFTVTATTAPPAFDVRTTTLAGKLTLDGGPLGTGAHCTNNPTDAKARIDLVDTATRASFSADVACGAADDSFSLRLAPGTYSVSAYSVYTDASNFPGTFVANPAFVVGSGSAAFDVRTIAVDGKVTMNGASLGVGAHCANNPGDAKVRLSFVDASAPPTFSFSDIINALPATAVSADVTCGAADSFSLQIPPGTYRVSAYSVYTDASSFPGGTFTAVGRIELR